MTLAPAALIVVRRPRPVNTGGIPPGADVMTVELYLHRLVTIGTRHCTGRMMAGRHFHLGLAETMIDGTTVEVAAVAIVASRHPPPGFIVGAATRSRGRHLVRVRVHRYAERVHGTGTVLGLRPQKRLFTGQIQGSPAFMKVFCTLGVVPA